MNCTAFRANNVLSIDFCCKVILVFQCWVVWGDSMRPGVWRRLPQHWVGWVHVLIQMGCAGGGQGKKGTKGGTNASALSLWCWEAGGPRRGSGASPLVPVRKRGWRSLLFSVSLFNQLLYITFSTKIGFLFSLKNQEAILKEIFWQVLQPTLNSPGVYFDLEERQRKNNTYNPPYTYLIPALLLWCPFASKCYPQTSNSSDTHGRKRTEGQSVCSSNCLALSGTLSGSQHRFSKQSWAGATFNYNFNCISMGQLEYDLTYIIHPCSSL